MNWLNNFFIPLFQIMLIVSCVFSFLFILFRAIHKLWTKRWKFMIKYKFNKYNEEDLRSMIEMMKKDTRQIIEMNLLINDTKKERVDELLYIYDLIKKKERKKEINDKKINKKIMRKNGGKENDRQI